MIPREILRKVKRIEIRTNRIVNDVFAGQYVSVFRGRGMEFDTVREYLPGDEIRSIDWNVTARMGRPYVKKFVEERELTVVLLVDISPSGAFGSRERFKNEVATELCAVIAFAAIKNNDKVGLIMFTDRIEKFILPKKGSKHALRVIRELLFSQPQGKGTDIALALDYLNRVIRRRSVVFLVSDFIAPSFEQPLKIANKRFDMVAVVVADPRELELPDVGLVQLQDAETGEVVLIDTHDPSVRREYDSLVRRRVEQNINQFKSLGMDYINISTDSSYIEPLLKFFRMRARRLQY